MELSADEASRRAGRPDAIRNLRRKVASGAKGSLRFDTLAALASILQTTPDDLLGPEKPVDAPPVSAREYLLAQIDLLQRQVEAIDEAEFTARKARKRKIR